MKEVTVRNKIETVSAESACRISRSHEFWFETEVRNSITNEIMLLRNNKLHRHM